MGLEINGGHTHLLYIPKIKLNHHKTYFKVFCGIFRLTLLYTLNVQILRKIAI